MKEYLVIDNHVGKDIVKFFSHFNIRYLPKMLQYYTMWGLFAHFLLPDEYHCLLIMKFQMAMQIALGGFYITYIHPCYLNIPFWKIIVRQIPLYLCDALSHYIPLFYYFVFHEIQYCSLFDFFIGYIPVAIYFCLFDFYNYYHIRQKDFLSLVLIYILFSTFIGYSLMV